MSDGPEILAFDGRHAAAVRALFVEVNRLLAPPGMEAAFAACVARSLEAKMGRVAAYYGERGGGIRRFHFEKLLQGGCP